MYTPIKELNTALVAVEYRSASVTFPIATSSTSAIGNTNSISRNRSDNTRDRGALEIGLIGLNILHNLSDIIYVITKSCSIFAHQSVSDICSAK